MKEEVVSINWEYEDELERDITPMMFNASQIVSGVRMYPYVILNNAKLYLENHKKNH